MKKLKLYTGQTPTESVSIKIDGIQVMLDECGCVVSRSNKPIYNLDTCLLELGKKYEVFLGSFKETDSVLSTHNHERKVNKNEIYEIWPGVDKRLSLPLNCDLEKEFQRIVSQGGEGLVIDHKYKMKTIENHDVKILDVIPGKGRHLGRMGALMTTKGKVGTGFTDVEREEDWISRIGHFIEVECMELFPSGKFRNPRYSRYRWDKND